MSIQIKSLLCVLTILLLSTTTHASSKSGEELIEAAKQRNAEAVVTLLEKEIDTNATQQDGATALHWAAHWNEFDTAKLLLEAGARPNVTNQYGVTPLFFTKLFLWASVVIWRNTPFFTKLFLWASVVIWRNTPFFHQTFPLGLCGHMA